MTLSNPSLFKETGRFFAFDTKIPMLIGSSLIQLGKYGAFPASQLIGLHYDITYEIVSSSGSGASTPQPGSLDLSTDETQNKKGNKKSGNKGKEIAAISKNNPGWNNILKPLKRQPVVDAVIG